MCYKFLLLSICLLLFFDSKSIARNRSEEDKKIVNFYAKKLQYKKIDGKGVNELKGNVVFKKKDITIFADEALYEEQKQIEAKGNIRVVNSDGVELHTSILKYDIDQERAEFFEGVKLIDGKTILTSDRGEYNDGDQMAIFIGNVHSTNEDQEFMTDTLIYDNLNQKYINDHPKLFKGVSLNSENSQKVYIGQGNVVILVPKEKIRILGDHLVFYNKKNRSKVYGMPLLHKKIEKDDIYFYGKKLFILEDENSKQDSKKQLIVDENAKIFHKDFQARANEINYTPSKEKIFFNHKPIFWNEDNQITAQKALLQIKNEKVEKIHLTENVLLIQKTKQKNYNQVRGNIMDVSLDNNKLKLIEVKEDAESIQYLDDQKKKNSKILAINHIKCDRIKMKTKKNKISRVIFINQKETNSTLLGQLNPPAKATIESVRLEGFDWRIYERPTFDEVQYLMRKHPNKTAKKIKN